MVKVTSKQQIQQITIPTPFPVGDVHTYVILGEKVTLVDAGVRTKEAWEYFKKELNVIGLTPDDIDQIVVTHQHPDHVGLIDFFRRDIPVIGHERSHLWMIKDEAYLKTHTEFYLSILLEAGVDQRFFPLTEKVNDMLHFSCNRGLTDLVDEGDSIQGLDGWKVLYTPGHSSAHISLWHEQKGTLIGGDVLLAHISPNPLIEPCYPGEDERRKALVEYIASLEKLSLLPIRQVLPGHGNNISNAKELIEERLLKQEKRAEKVLAFIRKQPRTAYEICVHLFPTVYEKQLMLTLSETIGQLDYLEDAKMIEVDRNNVPHQYRGIINESNKG
ncbi:MBL fold metallo-hydrolase [Sutcliffiella sp. NC1]|uniref:MBL fold metallo-hydrolase n=1 Tax=Sutcliffiella sp. NC1 TaxID=3004096 RepID=UPI0022DDD7DC|nr:MBL fold metallo-hydrolase [Sutcliffiella sp. NC1]WBL13596.1 MBL fold metallo-hydrolase [Sutcliffiella sp. NC1]